MDKTVEYSSHVNLPMDVLLLTPTQVRACFGAWTFLILSHLSSAAAAIESPLRIACVGDSITAGAGVEAELESYPAQLSQQLGEGYEQSGFDGCSRARHMGQDQKDPSPETGPDLGWG